MMTPTFGEESKAPIITSENKLHILPYLSEFSNQTAAFVSGSKTGHTFDNTPRMFEQQAAKLPAGFHRMLYPDPFPTGTVLPNVEQFIQFINSDRLFVEAPHGRLFVIFTHGHFLEKFIAGVGYSITKEERPNYAAFRVTYYPTVLKKGVSYGPGSLKSCEFEVSKFVYDVCASASPSYFFSDALDVTKECELESGKKIPELGQ